MTAAIDRLLRLIPKQELRLSALEERSLLSDASELLSKLGGIHLEHELFELALRAIETRLLADRVLTRLGRFSDAYVGRLDELVRDRLEEILQTEPPQELVDYIRDCLETLRSSNSGKAQIRIEVVQAVFERLAVRQGELRCEVCGYHFRDQDTGQDRREIAEELGLARANYLVPGRSSDVLKPVAVQSRNSRELSLLSLDIDHITPEAGLGPTNPDNLRVLCHFCNNGKLIYRRPNEALGVSIASSLMWLRARSHSQPRQITVVSALANSSGRCCECGLSRQETELTVRLMSPPSAVGDWFIPANLLIVCYACAAPP